jgi:hypothetical protein
VLKPESVFSSSWLTSGEDGPAGVFARLMLSVSTHSLTLWLLRPEKRRVAGKTY